MQTYEDLESNKFVEGVAYPKSTVRTQLVQDGELVSSDNPTFVTGEFSTTLEQIENPNPQAMEAYTQLTGNPDEYLDRLYKSLERLQK